MARMTLACATTANTCENETTPVAHWAVKGTRAITAATTSVSTGPPISAVATP